MAQTEPQPNFPDCWLGYGAPNELLREFGRSQPLAGAPRAGALLPFQLPLAMALTVTVLLDLPPLVRLTAGLLALVLWASTAANVRVWRKAPERIDLEHIGLVARMPLRRQLSVRWESIAAIDAVTAAGRTGVAIGVRAETTPGHRGPNDPASRRAGYALLLWPADGDYERLARVLLRYCLDPRARRRYLAVASAATV